MVVVKVKGANVFPGTIEAIVREYPEIVEFQCLARLDLDDPELVLQVGVQRDHEAIVASPARDVAAEPAHRGDSAVSSRSAL
jgi:phenylacetate-coenzyme A ligase PaaK-like adenylate-forming protein